MSKTPKYWNTAKKYLSKKDKTMSFLIKKYKSPSETVLTSRKDVFYSLCKSIIGQQISVAAANSVFLKFKKRCKNKINAKTISKLSSIQLKSCGLSRQKISGIKNLAKQMIDRSFNPRLINKMGDEEAIIYLSSLKQIGRWSAEMILLFRTFLSYSCLPSSIENFPPLTRNLPLYFFNAELTLFAYSEYASLLFTFTLAIQYAFILIYPFFEII